MSSADARVGALEQHVLDEMRDAAALVALVPRPAHQPDADRHRPHMRHRLGDEAQTVVQNLANDHALRRLVTSTRGACDARVRHQAGDAAPLLGTQVLAYGRDYKAYAKPECYHAAAVQFKANRRSRHGSSDIVQ